MDPQTQAWAAGLFEGEGSIGFRKVSTGRAPTSLRLGMTDFDVVEAFKEAIGGVGNLRVETRYRPHKDLMYWEVSGFENIEYVLLQLRPWLKTRRGDAADEALSYIAKSREPKVPAIGLGKKCLNGHFIDQSTLYVDPSGRRHCRKCRKDAKLRHKTKALVQVEQAPSCT